MAFFTAYLIGFDFEAGKNSNLLKISLFSGGKVFFKSAFTGAGLISCRQCPAIVLICSCYLLAWISPVEALLALQLLFLLTVGRLFFQIF